MEYTKSVLKKIGIFAFSILFIFTSIYGVKIITSGVYSWAKMKAIKTHTGWERDILKGPTQSLESFEIKAITLHPGKESHTYLIDKGCDELVIIKEGFANISINSVKKDIGPGSITVASQGDRVVIKSLPGSDLVYYSLRFKPKPEKTTVKSQEKYPAVLTDWNSIVFKPSANGGRRDIIKQKTSVLKELEIHTTTLNEGLPSHAAHKHADEEIILVRFGTVEQTINGIAYKLGPGSVIFLTNNDMHGISNAGTGQCEYYAIRWLTSTGLK
jgi:uncharacterized cupin superfamily protein